MTGPADRFDVLVLGGGVQGLAALWNVARRGRRAALVERFAPGHDRGSSHGPTRVFRAGYPDPRYVALARAARGRWPELEQAAGERLVEPVPCCFFGPPDGLIAEYARGVAGPGSGVRPLDADAARARFPALALDGPVSVLEEADAAVLAADRTVAALARLARSAGATVLDGLRARRIDRGTDPLAVSTDGPTLRADRVVVTAGAWSADLVPELLGRLAPLRQTVGYLRLDDPAPTPIWIRLGRAANDVHYGLPTDRPGVVKIARHVTAGAGDDPDARPEAPDPAALDDLVAAARAVFRAPVAGVEGWDSCLYTSTPTEDFVVDRVPDDPRIAVGTGFSGHGFKFAPLVGAALAGLALDGATGVPELDALAPALAIRPRSS